MKKLLIVILLLSPVSVVAAKYMLVINFVAPNEREQCIKKSADNSKCLKYQPLSIDEIKGYWVFDVDCNNPVPNNHRPKMLPAKQHTIWFPSDKKQACIVMTAVDTDGRESLFSDVFVARDFREPRAISCKLYTQ